MCKKAALVCLLLLAFGVCHAARADNPNVIFVLADDLGIGDITPTNQDCKIKTPNLQTMAKEGLTFLDAHSSSSVCTPTRYGLLTGRYNWRSRLAKGVLNGKSEHLIPAERETVAHLLHRPGYHSKMIGKWHLGWDWAKTEVDGKKKIDFTKPVLNGPDINGFDNYYGHCGSLDMLLMFGSTRASAPRSPNAKKESPKSRILTAGIAKGRSVRTSRSMKYCRICLTKASNMSTNELKTPNPASHFFCICHCPHPTRRSCPSRPSKTRVE